ncbi:uncharacterized protein LOC124307974 [Neodiprion virginianus]|uniref:uncharacterized protein LOC124307974 n=1 Tax=Neodiprion virginianus TaxID=2961670 RepID=UPI001EE6DDA1|nr:uncharacterized protein LOC124307974 [Neodiprion virginianus]
MNKWRETKSATTKSNNKPVSKIATRVNCEKSGKNRSSWSANSALNLIPRDDAELSANKSIPKEAKPDVTLELITRKKATDDQKLRVANKNPSSIDQSSTTPSSEISSKNDKREFDETSHRQKSKSNQKKKFFDELIQCEGSVETLLQTKKPAKTIYDVDVMTPDDIRKTLARIDSNTAKPFSFLTDIIDDPQNEKRKLTTQGICDQELDPTDIDLQLASLIKRVELNRSLLEKTNQRIKDVNFITERNRMILLRDMNYDEDTFLLMKEAGDIKGPVSPVDLSSVSHPAIDELQKTMSSTIEMLEYVHKMSNGDLTYEEIPPELTDYLNAPITVAGENLQND